jgi:hypothetical protein
MLVSGAHVPTFSEIDRVYARDKRFVYYRGERVLDADPRTFRNFAGEYYIDAEHAYFRGEQLKDSNASSFDIVPGVPYITSDGANEYYNATRIEIVSSTTANAFLIAPFEGDELSEGATKVVFWKTVADSDSGEVLIRLLGWRGNELATSTWLLSKPIQDMGQYDWEVFSLGDGLSYSLDFYLLDKQGQYQKIPTPNRFAVSDSGIPGVRVFVDFVTDDVVYVETGKNSHIAWSASNVDRCYLEGGGDVGLQGHSYMQFYSAEMLDFPEYEYGIECTTDTGITVSDSITVRHLFPEVVE